MKLPDLHLVIKQKSQSLPRHLAVGTFRELQIVFSTRLSLLYLLNGPKMLSSASDKAKLLAKNFSKNSNLDDSGISVSIFRSGTNLKLHNISVTPKMVKKVILNLDSSNAPGPDVVPVVVLKNCEPEGHILKSILRFRTKFALAGYFGSKQQMNICEVLRDLVPFVQFKKRGKHPWRSVTFIKGGG